MDVIDIYWPMFGHWLMVILPFSDETCVEASSGVPLVPGTLRVLQGELIQNQFGMQNAVHSRKNISYVFVDTIHIITYQYLDMYICAYGTYVHMYMCIHVYVYLHMHVKYLYICVLYTYIYVCIDVNIVI